MNTPTDVLGKDLFIGAHVGCAFSYSQASVGHLRLGIIEEMFEDPPKHGYGKSDVALRIRWDENGVLSPKVTYGAATRWIVL